MFCSVNTWLECLADSVNNHWMNFCCSLWDRVPWYTAETMTGTFSCPSNPINHTFTMFGCKETPVNTDVEHLVGANWILIQLFSVMLDGNWEKEWDLNTHHSQNLLSGSSLLSFSWGRTRGRPILCLMIF